MDEQYEARSAAAYMGMQGAEQRSNAKFRGGLAQLGEHLLCKQGVVGSIPSSSTTTLGWGSPGGRHHGESAWGLDLSK